MKVKHLIGSAIVLVGVSLGMAWIFSPPMIHAQTAPPGIHQQIVGCDPCEVWLDAGMAEKGISGFIARLPEKTEINPPDPFFTFSGFNADDLVHISRDVSWKVGRADLADVIRPTSGPVMLFAYKGPYRPVKRMDFRIDDDSGDLILHIEFGQPVEVVLPGA